MVAANALTAAKVGDLETLKQLSLSENVSDKNLASCIHYAARGGSLPVLEYLIKTCNFSAFQRTKTGATGMHDAAARGNTAVVKWFHDNTELPVDDQDGIGITSLHLAARYCHFLTVEWLLDEADSDSSIRTASGALPLHFAVVGGDLNCVKILVDENPRMINMQMSNGATPVYLACQNGYLEVLQYLVSRNGATKIKAYDAMSCLHAAAQMGHLDIVKWLVTEEKMNPNDRDFDGATPVHYAASMGHPAVVKWLLGEGGARITLDNLGGSPLHTAVEFGEYQSVQALLECGCDVNLTDNDGLTAGELAVKCNQDQAAALIRGDEEGRVIEDSAGEDLEEQLTALPSRSLPLHSPRLSFPPPPSYPPDGELNPQSVTTAVNTSFLDYETRSPSPPLPPPPDYSPEPSTPPSIGSPITPPSPINLDSLPEEDPPQPFQGLASQQGNFNVPGFGLNALEKPSSFIVTAEVHSADDSNQKEVKATSGRPKKLPPPVPVKHYSTIQTSGRCSRIRVTQPDSSTPYQVVENCQTKPNPSSQRQFSSLTRPASFKNKVENQYGFLELEPSSSVLSTSDNSVYSFRSTETVVCTVSPTSPQLCEKDIGNNFLYLLGKGDKNPESAVNDSVEDLVKPSSVAQFKALFEKRVEYRKDFPQRKPFNMGDTPVETNSNGTTGSETKQSPRSSTVLAMTQPLKEGRQPGKYVVNGKPESDIANGGAFIQSNGGLAFHAEAIAAVARRSQRFETPSETSSPNASQPEVNGTQSDSKEMKPVQNSESTSSPSSPASDSTNTLPKPQSPVSPPVITNKSPSSPATMERKSNKNDLMADIQSAVSGTSNLTLRRAKSRGEGVSMVYQSSKSLKRNSGNSSPSPSSPTSTSSASTSTAEKTTIDNNVLSGDFDPKNFLDKVEKVDSTGRAIPEWRRHVLAKHAAEKAQKDFEERKQVEDYEARFKNVPAWKRALIERKEQQAKEEMQNKK